MKIVLMTKSGDVIAQGYLPDDQSFKAELIQRDNKLYQYEELIGFSTLQFVEVENIVAIEEW